MLRREAYWFERPIQLDSPLSIHLSANVVIDQYTVK